MYLRNVLDKEIDARQNFFLKLPCYYLLTLIGLKVCKSSFGFAQNLFDRNCIYYGNLLLEPSAVLPV